MVAPRLFCDICDMFDLHDTEDCPRQAMDSPPPPQHKVAGKKRAEERPYCENCEGKCILYIFILISIDHELYG